MAEEHGEAIKGLLRVDDTDVEVLHDRWGIKWAFLLSMCYIVTYLSWDIIYQKYLNYEQSMKNQWWSDKLMKKIVR